VAWEMWVALMDGLSEGYAWKDDSTVALSRCGAFCELSSEHGRVPLLAGVMEL